MDRREQTWRTVIVAVLLGIMTLAIYWPVRNFEFINIDDHLYVFDNPRVMNGFSWRNVSWALTTGHTGNWHPLTWLSHMVDVELFGLRAGWHHFVNVLFHTANTILLFFLLRRIAGYGPVADLSPPGSKAPLWRCAFVAALFAVHPLHVESVAWVSERKDVLSTLFFLLTLHAYVSFAEKVRSPAFAKATAGTPQSVVSSLKSGVARYYVLSLVFFALGLMSKPMLVSTPFVLLLLDFWPLQRVSSPQSAPKAFGGSQKSGAARPDLRTTDYGLSAVASAKAGLRTLLELVREKVPFLLLAALSCVATLEAQSRGHAVTLGLPLGLRLANAVVSYLKYLGKMVWPVRLAVLYPHPNLGYFNPHPGAAHPASEQWPLWQVLAAAAVLVLISVLAWIRRERQPWFLFGWLWFLGTLVPVIGIVQVGLQGMADRYTYIPLVGIFIVCAWWAAQALGHSDLGRRLAALASVSVLAVCLALTHRQLGYWRNNFALFSRTLQVTRNNVLAAFGLGDEYGDRRQFGMALAYFRGSLRMNPNFADAHFGLAHTYVLTGKPQEAVEEYKAGLQLAPWNYRSHNLYGKVLWDLGRRQEALVEYAVAIRLEPNYAPPHYNVGVAYAEMGDYEVAAVQLAWAARLQPGNPDVLSHLGEALVRIGRAKEARRAYAEAAQQFELLVRRDPSDPEARCNLGGVLCRLGRPDEAEPQYREAVRLQPANPAFCFNLGLALASQGKFSDAAEQFAQATKLKPDYSAAWNEQGRCLAAQSKFAEAAAAFGRLTRLMPTNSAAELNQGNALMMAGQTNDATVCFSNALRLDPALVENNVQAARACAGNRDARGALARFRTALLLKPDDPALLNELALFLATTTDNAVRDVAEAARLAQRACHLSGGKDPRYLATLDIAYAQAGRFPEAISAAEKTRDAAVAGSQADLARAAESRLDLYRKQLPAHQ